MRTPSIIVLSCLLGAISGAAFADTPVEAIKKPGQVQLPSSGGATKPMNLTGVQIKTSGLAMAKAQGLIKAAVKAMGNPVYRTSNGLLLTVVQPADTKYNTGSSFQAKGVLWDYLGHKAIAEGSPTAGLVLQVPPRDTWWSVLCWFSSLPSGVHTYEVTVNVSSNGLKPTITVGNQLFEGQSISVTPTQARAVFLYDASTDDSGGVLVGVGYKGEISQWSVAPWYFQSVRLRQLD